jgi:hypothetical protein
MVASTVTYPLPIVSVILGTAVLEESISVGMTIGAAVVLLGVALTSTRRNSESLLDTRRSLGPTDCYRVAVLTDRQQQFVQAVRALADEYLPTQLSKDDVHLAQVFGVAAIRHASNLLQGELDYALLGRWSITRVVGRQIAEAWLWANILLLGGDEAIERLTAEDADHQRRLDRGRRLIWEQLESLRDEGIDPRRERTSTPAQAPRSPNIGDLASEVRRLREARGLGGGIAAVSYQITHRWESVHDVHIGFDLLTRYLDLSSEAPMIRAEPGPEDITPFRGPESLQQDTRLVADAIGIYLIVTERFDELDRARQAMSDLDG